MSKLEKVLYTCIMSFIHNSIFTLCALGYLTMFFFILELSALDLHVAENIFSLYTSISHVVAIVTTLSQI